MIYRRQVICRLHTLPVFGIEAASLPVHDTDDLPSSAFPQIYYNIRWAEITVCENAFYGVRRDEAAQESSVQRRSCLGPGENEVFELPNV